MFGANGWLTYGGAAGEIASQLRDSLEGYAQAVAGCRREDPSAWQQLAPLEQARDRPLARLAAGAPVRVVVDGLDQLEDAFGVEIRTALTRLSAGAGLEQVPVIASLRDVDDAEWHLCGDPGPAVGACLPDRIAGSLHPFRARHAEHHPTAANHPRSHITQRDRRSSTPPRAETTHVPGIACLPAKRRQRTAHGGMIPVIRGRRGRGAGCGWVRAARVRGGGSGDHGVVPGGP